MNNQSKTKKGKLFIKKNEESKQFIAFILSEMGEVYTHHFQAFVFNRFVTSTRPRGDSTPTYSTIIRGKLLT